MILEPNGFLGQKVLNGDIVCDPTGSPGIQHRHPVKIYYPRTSVETRTQPWQYRNGTNRRRRSYLRMSDYRAIFCRSLPTTCTFSSPRPFVVRFRLLIGGVCFSVTDACVSRYEDLNNVYITVHSHFYSWRFQGGGRGTG